MAQTYSDKPTLEAWNALGQLELIREGTFSWNSSLSRLDLNDIDWGAWSFVIVALYLYIDSTSTSSTTTFGSPDLTLYGNLSEEQKNAAFLFLFTPMRDASRRARVLIFPSGASGVSNDPFSKLKAINLYGHGSGSPGNVPMAVYGIR